jgi:NADH-quinone oxidoreductase subunit M
MNGFVGEFLIMLGAFRWDPRFVVVAGLGVILSAVYMLWMFQRVYYGEITNEHNRQMPDLSFREWAIVGPLAAAAIFMGVFPNVFLKPMEPGVTRIVQRMEQRQPMQTAAPVHPRTAPVALVAPVHRTAAIAPIAPVAP